MVSDTIEQTEEIYIVLINNKPYGYYYKDEETSEQIEQAKEHIMKDYLFEFNKTFYWDYFSADDDYIKVKLISNTKNNVPSYDRVEGIVEIVKSKVLPLKKVL